MSTYRITQRAVGQRSLDGLQANLGRVGKLQEQLSSGRLLNRPSDSPTGTVSAMQLRSEVRVNEQWGCNASDGLGWLGTIDQTLTSALGSVRRLRDITLQGMSTGSTSAAAREAIAVEVDKLGEGLVGLANTTYLDRPVFGGTTPGGVAYAADGTYLGDGTPVLRTVSAGAAARVDVTGPEVFGTGPDALFAVVSDIADHLRTDPEALGADLDRLDAVMRGIQGRLADVGARHGRVEQMRQAADDRVITLRTALSEVENIDLPKTIVELQLQQVAYQAALGATSRVVTPSLVDFLR